LVNNDIRSLEGECVTFGLAPGDDHDIYRLE
jgi:hypothetical protein